MVWPKLTLVHCPVTPLTRAAFSVIVWAEAAPLKMKIVIKTMSLRAEENSLMRNPRIVLT
jgi:hypothetical protein